MSPERREKARLRAQRWRAANRERHRAYTRNYRKEHSAEVAAKNKKWAQDHPRLVRRYHRESRRRRPDSYKQSALRWQAKNPDARRSFCAARRAKKAAVGGTFTRHQWAAMKERFGHRCLCCRKKFNRLSMDHIVPIDKGGPHCEENIQPLCIRCNSAKGTKTIDYRPRQVELFTEAA